MRRSLTLVAGPTDEPVTLDEAKNWMKVDATDDDPLISSLVTAARMAAENYTRRALISQTWRLTIDLPGSNLADYLSEGVHDLPVSALYGDLPDVIELSRPPVQSITSVTTYNLSDESSTFASSNYRLDSAGGRLALTYGSTWPSNLRRIGSVEILFVAGYGDTCSSVPQPIRSAILMHVMRMYDGRTVCDMPKECELLLQQYRVMSQVGV